MVNLSNAQRTHLYRILTTKMALENWTHMTDRMLSVHDSGLVLSFAKHSAHEKGLACRVVSDMPVHLLASDLKLEDLMMDAKTGFLAATKLRKSS